MSAATQDRQLARLPAQGSIRQPARLPAQRSIRQLKSADFQPGGNLLFVIDRSGGAFLWEPGSEDEPRDLGGQGRNVLAGQFSADGKLLAMTLSDKTVVVWDVDAGRFVGEPLRGHRQAAEQVVFSPDGRWLATSAGNRRVKVWKVPEGTPWLTVSQPQDVHEIRFLPDSRSLLAYNEQSPRPFLWPLDLPAVARERLNRDLTPAERTRFDVGSPEEREALRRPWEGTRLCRELRLATRLVAANPENARAGQLVNRVVRELVAFSRTGAPDEVDASLACAREVLDGLPVEGSVFVEGRVTLQHAVGDLSGAVRTLEFAVAGRPSASLESRLHQYRREALPDLPSFASIDLAVREQTKLIPVGAKWRYNNIRAAAGPGRSSGRWSRPGTPRQSPAAAAGPPAARGRTSRPHLAV